MFVCLFRSDGGLIVCLLEMAFAGNCGIDICITTPTGEIDQLSAIEYLFNENLGLVIEILPQNNLYLENVLNSNNIPFQYIGKVKEISGNISISFNGNQVILERMSQLRDIWESTSFALELLQCNPICVQEERKLLLNRSGPIYRVTYDTPFINLNILKQLQDKPKVAILRQEGTNGDREMASAFYSVGFDVWDVNMKDLLSKSVTLDLFQGIVFCGGFSYADVNGSAKGWAATIRFNDDLVQQFNSFKNRSNTFSLGVCNGCQLMALLGWVPFNNSTESIDEVYQPRFLHNKSNRFESRWCNVKIHNSNSILLQNMENNVLGIWVSHGEGCVTFPDPSHLDYVKSNNLIPLSYVDDNLNPTELYPMNPNGSPLGIAGLCSEDGRHLAIMPHPERCFLKWQWPYQPYEWKFHQFSEFEENNDNNNNHKIETSPWIKLFQNAYNYCVSFQT